ncbi:hypothetical protein ACFVTY_12175 [Streptomyces sp. NPDC058067]
MAGSLLVLTIPPEGVLRCILSVGHYGEHRHFQSGELRNGSHTGTT